MKLNDIYETASGGVTSVASIGNVEYALGGKGNISLYKDNCCIAKIKRRPRVGWSMQLTSEWNNKKLPKIGYINNLNTKKRGIKTHEKNLENMLSSWGIRYDSLVKKNQSS